MIRVIYFRGEKLTKAEKAAAGDLADTFWSDHLLYRSALSFVTPDPKAEAVYTDVTEVEQAYCEAGVRVEPLVGSR